MLVNEPRVLNLDSSDLLFVNPEEIHAKQSDGIYIVSHLNCDHYLPMNEYIRYPRLIQTTEEFVDNNYKNYFGSYGVCDNVEQILERCPELVNSDRQFVITLYPIKHCEEPAEGGWRWHKWGEYIGEQDPQHEYMYNEVGIEVVYCYKIFEKKTDWKTIGDSLLQYDGDNEFLNRIAIEKDSDECSGLHYLVLDYIDANNDGLAFGESLSWDPRDLHSDMIVKFDVEHLIKTYGLLKEDAELIVENKRAIMIFAIDAGYDVRNQ